MTRSRFGTALAVLLLAVASLGLVAAPASAQDGTDRQEEDGGHIIPKPNSGHAPEEAGDRGGALQLLILGVVVVAIGGGIALLVRESKRAKAS